jgi:hypothetical protein
MAVLAEAISVIVRADSIEAKFPGGWDSFMGWVENRTLCADHEIARVGFMSPADTKGCLDQLIENGLIYLADGEAVDIVVSDQQRGFAVPCGWAEFGRISWNGDDQKMVPAVRLKGSKITELMTSEGWTFEGSLSHRFTFVETGKVPEYLDYLRTEGGLDVYRDIRSGKEVFIPKQPRK